MRLNLPVTQREQDVPADRPLVSTTDAQGRITHCNRAFVEVSGYGPDELLGQPHSVVRHPDMPEEAFQDLWSTIGRGRPWSGIVKNRCKNGDHYWVQANVTPVLVDGKPVGYMSVRLRASREQVAQAEALYARLRAERDQGRRTLRLHAGGVRRHGWRDLPYRVFRLSFSQRVAVALACVFGAGTLPGALGLGVAVQGAALAAAVAVVGLWMHRSIARRLDRCTDLAAQVAGCNLSGHVDYDMRHPLGQLMRSIWLTNLNLRAIVDDVRGEVHEIVGAARELAAGSRDLAHRSERQSASVQQTASAVEQISATVQRTAAAAQQVARVGDATRGTAQRGGAAMAELAQAMHGIDRSSREVHRVIAQIEGIAFQTGLLSLNAAVEAARAGEQGRGFAVVAAEVRALSQRVTRAAQEVRALATEAVDQAAQGGRRMAQTDAVIGDVVGAVDEVGRLVRDIAQVAQEQRAGIGEIGAAMASIDQASQHNAALSEQASAACDTMQARTGTLMRAVQIFGLAQAQAGPPPGR